MNRRMLYLNGAAILAVVLYHAGAFGFIAMFAWAGQYLPASVPPGSQVGSLSYYVLRLSQQIGEIAIPAFLVVAGYSITTAVQRDRSTVSWQVVFSRIKSLLIPYLIWSTVVILLNILQGKTYSPGKLLSMFLMGSTNQVLYFVPLLIQFYLLAPFLILWVKKSWKTALVITLLVQLFVYTLRNPLLFSTGNILGQQWGYLVHKSFLIARIFWFPLGITIGFHATEFKNWIQPRRWFFVALIPLTIIIGTIEFELYFRNSGLEWLPYEESILDAFSGIAVIFSVLAFDIKRLPVPDTVSLLGANSYVIYLTHAIFMEYTARAINISSGARFPGIPVDFLPFVNNRGVGRTNWINVVD